MHCPQCGQHQMSEEMRFCSRCGFPLDGVAQLLANGGGVLQTTAGVSSCSKLSPRRKGVRRGATLMMLGVVLVPLLAILIAPQHGSLPDGWPYILIPLSALICFAGGLMRILYALLFQESATPIVQAANAAPSIPPMIAGQLNMPARGTMLHPPNGAPVPAWKSPQANTAEILSPVSVTENTTRLLKDERDQTSL